MNLCIFSIQTILLAVLVVQYNFINEVDAESHNVGNWYSSMEKKFEAVQNGVEPEVTIQEVKENKSAPKIRRKIIKKHRKRNNKHDHLHVPHEQRLDASNQLEKAEGTKKAVRKNHKKKEKKWSNQKKFVKTTLMKESNSSESDEVKRRKPVDIIVHIKMND